MRNVKVGIAAVQLEVSRVDGAGIALIVVTATTVDGMTPSVGSKEAAYMGTKQDTAAARQEIRGSICGSSQRRQPLKGAKRPFAEKNIKGPPACEAQKKLNFLSH